MSSGYIKIWRKIKAHPFWQDGRTFSRFEAWMDMLMSANGIDKEISFREEPMLIPRGSFITSEYKLSEKWGWSRNKVRRFLDHCVENGMIANQKRYHRNSMITVINYDTYNPLGIPDDTTEKPQNEEEKLFKKEFDEFMDAYDMKVAPDDAFKAFKALRRKGVEFKTIMEAVKGYSNHLKNERWKKQMYPATFLRSNRWKDFVGVKYEPEL